MTVLAGAVRNDLASVGESALRRMVGAARSRGGDQFRMLGGVLAAQWARGDRVAIAQEGECTVVADASLYYVHELRQALSLAGRNDPGESPAALILSAYRAWGVACAERLEGDFAFIVWDDAARILFAARDFGGKRPLHYAAIGTGLIIGSTVGAVAAHPDCPQDLDLREIGADAAGLLFAERTGTCYQAVRVLPAGMSLSWRPQRAPELRRHWHPPVFNTARRTTSFEDGAAELRSLLVRAVIERMPPEGPAAVLLSGGWDSTAVYGAGQQGVRAMGSEDRLRAVSISYPEGDPGREDELIRATVDHWQAPVHWIDIANIPFFRDPASEAARRDEPFAHTFEHWNRALGRESAALGCRVAFDGCGGDQLFQVSNVLLADLLRRGRLLALHREWRAKGLRGSGAREFFRWAVRPMLPPMALALATRLRKGRPLRSYLDKRVPSFIRRDFAERFDLDAYSTPGVLGRHSSPAANEHELYLSNPFFPRIFSVLAGLALEAGVELRSPLYDARVVTFAASRPVRERSEGAETKRLLRAAMRGLLPDEVLAPRAARTGTTGGYFRRSMLEGFGQYVDTVLHQPLLADLGVVEPRHIRATWEWYRRSGNDEIALPLFFTLQTELWLRARLEGAGRGTSAETERVPDSARGMAAP